MKPIILPEAPALEQDGEAAGVGSRGGKGGLQSLPTIPLLSDSPELLQGFHSGSRAWQRTASQCAVGSIGIRLSPVGLSLGLQDDSEP